MFRKNALCAASALAMMAGAAYADSHSSLTIAIVNNGHMINMQTVAEAYSAETGVELTWVPLEERYNRGLGQALRVAQNLTAPQLLNLPLPVPGDES